MGGSEIDVSWNHKEGQGEEFRELGVSKIKIKNNTLRWFRHVKRRTKLCEQENKSF